MRKFASERASRACVGVCVARHMRAKCVRMVVVSLKLTACVCRVALWSATRSLLKQWQGKRDTAHFFTFFFKQKCYANKIASRRSAKAPRPLQPAVYTIHRLTWAWGWGGMRGCHPNQIISTSLAFRDGSNISIGIRY